MKKHFNNPDSCTACTVCIAHCPVAAVTRKFKGPKLVGPALERMRLFQEDIEPTLEYCTNCKNCDTACPSGVPISTLNMLARADFHKKNGHKLRDWILSHGEFLAKLTSNIPDIANYGMKLSRKILKFIGISDKAPIPEYAPESFMKQFRKIKQISYQDKVVFFPGCFINYNDPQVGLDLIDVMQKNKFEVIVEESFSCCGSPMVVTGYLNEAKKHAEHNYELLKNWTDQNIPIITCCTSCSLMLKQEYQELFEFEGIEEYSKLIFDAGEFLLELYENKRLNTDFRAIDKVYIYHAPCHLRTQGIGLPALELFKLVPNINVKDADSGCCGISGNYGFKDDKYNIAMAVGSKLFKTIQDSRLDTAISECGTCRLQINHGTGVKVKHPISVLKEAYNC